MRKRTTQQSCSPLAKTIIVCLCALVAVCLYLLYVKYVNNSNGGLDESSNSTTASPR